MSGVEGPGLYEGLSGIAFALEETYKAAKDEKYRRAFLDCLERIRSAAAPAGTGVEWSPTTDIISGGAGTGLFLIYAYHETGDRTWLDLAARAGTRLVELGRPENGGLKWAMDPSFPRLMPNFSHGTAGIAYYLAALYRETRRPEFLEAALAGARYLVSVAKTEGDSCLVFHDEPDNRELYYLGWCHGPVGTARLFFLLAEVTGDRTWLDWVRRSANGLLASGIPEQETPGFWNNAGICCGLAGVGEFFLDLSKALGDESYLEFSKRVAARLLAKADRRETAGCPGSRPNTGRGPTICSPKPATCRGRPGSGPFSSGWPTPTGPGSIGSSFPIRRSRAERRDLACFSRSRFHAIMPLSMDKSRRL